MIMDGGKVDDEATTFIFGDFHQCTRETREWIDRVFFCPILQVHIELDRVEVMMVEMESAVPDSEISMYRSLALVHLYVWIVRIELRYEKWSIRSCRRKIEPYLSVMSKYLETK